MKIFLVIAVAFLCLVGCSPTVKVQAPDKPIEINLNVKIQHEIRLQVDNELQGLFSKDSEVF
jgi:hypothetical protein